MQGDVLIYERTAADERVVVCLNFSDREQSISIPEMTSGAIVLASTCPVRDIDPPSLTLQPNEGLLLS